MDRIRAEGIATYMADTPQVLDIFGVDPGVSHVDGSIPDVVYVIWLDMLHSGLTMLSHYTPPEHDGEKGKWSNDAACAGYVILRVRMLCILSLYSIQQSK